MKTQRYETLLLVTPEITKDEASNLEKQIEQKIKNAKGSILSFDRWGKYKLAYPVRNNDYGVYFLGRFELDSVNAGQLIKEFAELFAIKFNDIVMRHMSSLLKTNDLNYIRPESLEEVPSRDVDSFLRENKMEGLMSMQDKGDQERENKTNTEGSRD